MAMVGGPIQGARISALPRRNTRFEADRLCSHPGCITKLSIYNNGKYCYQHEPMTVPRTRGKKIA